MLDFDHELVKKEYDRIYKPFQIRGKAQINTRLRKLLILNKVSEIPKKSHVYFLVKKIETEIIQNPRIKRKTWENTEAK